MQKPLEVVYRGLEKSEAIDNLIREKTDKLERVCDYITGMQVAVERPHATVRNGNPFRVRLDITVPPGHEVVIRKEPTDNGLHDDLSMVVKNAFEAAEKKLKKITQIQRGERKIHPEQEMTAIIDKIYKDEGYGFIKSFDGRDIYFHRNSIINDDFENISTGTAVRFFEEMGEKGPQASTVHVENTQGSGA